MQDLQAPYIRKDNGDQQKIMNQIQEKLNPFNEEYDDKKCNSAYCLTTGKAASEGVKQNLLGCIDYGHKRCETFKDECLKNMARFEKAIPQSKLRNFASDRVLVKVTTKDRMVQEIQCSRDLFGRLLYLAIMDKDIALEVVFEFPLTPVPLSLAHMDGLRHTTKKSNLMGKLEVRTESEVPRNTDVVAVDAVFLLRTLVPDTMGAISKVVLQHILVVERVDFVCNSYDDSHYIKDVEYAKHGANQSDI